MSPQQIEELTDMFMMGEPNRYIKIFDNRDFGYSKVVIKRPKAVKELEKIEKFLALKDRDTVLQKLEAVKGQNKGFKDKKDFFKFLGVKLTKTEENMLIEKDYEKISLKDDIQRYFEMEVLPFVPDAWMDQSSIKVGYEISFSKYFDDYKPPRSLEDIYKDIKALEQKTENILEEIVGR